MGSSHLYDADDVWSVGQSEGLCLGALGVVYQVYYTMDPIRQLIADQAEGVLHACPDLWDAQ